VNSWVSPPVIGVVVAGAGLLLAVGVRTQVQLESVYGGVAGGRVVQELLPVCDFLGDWGVGGEAEGNGVAQLVGTVGVGTMVADHWTVFHNYREMEAVAIFPQN